jgi:hypothetical protein
MDEVMAGWWARADIGDMGALDALVDRLLAFGRADEALVELRARADSGHRSVQHRLADLLARQGLIDELWAMADKGSGEARDRLVEHLLSRRQVDDAFVVVQVLGSPRPEAARELLGLLWTEGRTDDVLDLILTHGLYDGIVGPEVAEQLARAGRTAEAIAVYEHGPAAGEREASGLARLLYDAHRIDEVVALLRRHVGQNRAVAVELTERIVAAPSVAGVVSVLPELVRLGTAPQAVDVIVVAIAHGWAAEVVGALRAMTDEGGRARGRRDALLAWVEGPNHGSFDGAVDALLRRQRIADAVAVLRARSGAGEGGATLRLISLFIERDRIDEAIALVKRKRTASHAEAAGTLARVLVERGRVDAAINVLAGQLDTGDRDVVFALADLLLDEGRIDESVRPMRRAAEHHETSLRRLIDVLQDWWRDALPDRQSRGETAPQWEEDRYAEPVNSSIVVDGRWLERADPGLSFDRTVPEPMLAGRPRVVNLAFLRAPRTGPLQPTRALAVSSTYHLRLDIGTFDPASIVTNPTEVPVEELPPARGGHWLEVLATGRELLAAPGPWRLFLPTRGPAWVCPCPPEAPFHTCEPADRNRYLTIPVTTPPEPTDARLRLGLYHGATIIQTFTVIAPVHATEEPAEPATAQCDFSISPDLTDVARLPTHEVSAVAETDGATHRLIIKDGAGETLVASLGDDARARLTRAVRTALVDIHIETIPAGWRRGTRLRNRFGADNSAPSLEQFRADLRTLAPLGRAAWDGLFSSVVDGTDVLYTLAGRAGLAMQIATPATSRFVFPWAVVYDVPLGSDPARYHDCEVLDSWDLTAPVPPGRSAGTCPHAETHDRDTICPYGFWGFRHRIEQPAPAAGRPLTRRVGPAEPSGACAVTGVGTAGLSVSHVRQHLDRVGALWCWPVRSCGADDPLATALATDDIAVAYLFCHGREFTDATGETATRLEFDHGETVAAGDLLAWGQEWGSDHWRAGGPLVFLNACHSVAVTPHAITDLVTGFTRIGAAGVVGTETTVHQDLAAEAAELFWEATVTRGLNVGDALRSMRRQLLAKGNVMGLAYTAYCADDLAVNPRRGRRLRPRVIRRTR